VLERLLVEWLLRRQQVAARRPRVRRATRDVSVAEVLGCAPSVSGGGVELLRRLLVQLRGRLQALLDFGRDLAPGAGKPAPPLSGGSVKPTPLFS
jgi:hypothetical protein